MTEHNAGSNDTDKLVCLIIYILYLCSIALPPLSLVGVIAAYIYRGEGDAWLRSHYSFQIRTFWWALLFGFIGWLLAFIFIGYIALFVLLIWYIARNISGIRELNKVRGLNEPSTLGFIAK